MKFAKSLILGLEKATSIVNYFAFPLRIEKKKCRLKNTILGPVKKKKNWTPFRSTSLPVKVISILLKSHDCDVVSQENNLKL